MGSGESSGNTDKRQQFFRYADDVMHGPLPLFPSLTQLISFSEEEIKREMGREPPDKDYINFCKRMKRSYTDIAYSLQLLGLQGNRYLC
jgi:hypothetical protein